MADYLVELGVKLNTKNIDAQINSYKNKEIKLKAGLDTSDISTALSSYKAKPIVINSTLNTDGITDKIKKYDPRKMIHLKSKLSMDNVEKTISGYQAKPIKLGAELYSGALNKAIKEQAGSITEVITVKAKLDDNAINSAISNWSSETAVIPIKVKPNFDEVNFNQVEELLENYTARTPLKVNAQLNKTAINNEISRFNAELRGDRNRDVMLQVKITDTAVSDAVSRYKSSDADKLKIPVDLTIQPNTEFDAKLKAKIAEYEKAPVAIPAKLVPYDKGFSSQIQKVPVPITATLTNAADINKEIQAYTGKEVPIKAKLIPANNFADNISKKVVPIYGKLNTEGINAAIDAFVPSSKMKIGVDLQDNDVNAQIDAIKATSKVKVLLDLDDNVSFNNDGINTKAPHVNVKLNLADINKQIKEFKPSSKITVGIKLDFASHKGGQVGIPQQIKNYKTNTRIKVGAELQTNDINSQIEQIHPTSKIKVLLDIDDNVNHKKINDIAQSSVKVRLDNDDINKQLREFNKESKVKIPMNLQLFGDSSRNNNISQQVKNAINQALREVGTNSPISMRIEIEPSSVQTVRTQINNIREELEALQEISININHSNRNNNNDGRTPQQIREAAQAYRDLMSVLTELNSKKIQLNNLDASSQESSNKIQTLRLQIEQLDNEYNNLLTSFNSNGIRFSAEQWNQLETIIARVGRQIDVVQSSMSDKAVIKNQTQAFKELMAISKEMTSLETSLSKLRLQGGNLNQIELLENQLRTLQSTYQQIVTTMNAPLTADQWSALYTQIARTSEELSEIQAKYVDIQTNKAQGIRDNFSGYESKLQSLVEKFDRIADETGEVEAGINRVVQALHNMKNANSDNTLIDAEEEFQRELKETNNLLAIRQSMDRQAKYQERQDASNESLVLKKESAMLKLTSMFEEGSAAARVFGQRAKQLANELNNCGNANIDNAIRKVNNLGQEVKNSHLQTKTFTSALKEQFQRYSSYLSVASVFMYATRAARSMFEQVKLIDSAMTELKKVTNETDASYDKFLTNAASRAKEIGTTIDGLVSSTADFARLGYGFEDSQKLAEVANIYAVVGDEIEGVEDATQSLVSTIAAFKGEMNGMSNSEFAMGIVDKMNEVSNNFAISSGGIGEALQRSASSMAAANNTLDETIAMITASNEVAQNPEKVGNAMKTMSMRIRGAKTELEEAGESTDGMAESTASLRQEMLALSGVDIMLNDTTFKSTYQIMDELSKKWENLSDIAQATIIELVAGKHQGNVFASLMANFDTAREALDTSLNSTGSAMAEHAKWSESLEARLNKLKASWQALSQSFLSSDFLKVALNSVIALIDAITMLIDTIGTAPTLIGGFAVGKAIWTSINIGGLKSIADILEVLDSTFPAVGNAVKTFVKSISGKSGLTAALAGAKGALAGLLSIVKIHPILAAVTAIGFVVSVYKKNTESAEELAERIEEVTTKYREQHKELNKIKGDYDTSNADSMISRYGELSKGVTDLGENVSLTTDEYSEYQSIVDTIANQIPSLVTGYNSQGSAILECAGNVDKLSESYKNLIKEQNNEVLKNGADIIKDFQNDLRNTSMYENNSENTNSYNTDHINNLKDIMNLSGDELSSYVNNLNIMEAERISELLREYGIERDTLFNDVLDNGFATESWNDHIIRAVNEKKKEVKSILNEASKDLNAYAEELGTVTEAYFSTAFLGGDGKIEDYSHLSDRIQNVINQIASGFDSEFYANLFDGLETDEEKYEALSNYLNSILSAFDGLSPTGVEKFEAAFDLKTKFNGGDISYGEYVNGLKNAGSLIGGISGLDEEIKSQVKLSLGLNEEGLVGEYEDLLNRLSNKEVENNLGLEIDEAKEFLNDLSSQEFSAFKSIIPEFEPVSEYELEKQLYKYTKGGSVNLKLRPEVDTSVLKDAGWEDAGEGAATVFTSTFSNAAGNVAMNFTPIIADKNGNYQGVLSPEELQEYAEGVIDGTREDNLNLQIGAKFEGKSAIAEAESAANYIHKLQDYYYNGVSAQLDEAIERAMAVNGLLNNLDLEVETTGIEALNTALAESKSATGLTAESISALKARYKDLDGYNVATLFEETANGIRLNSTELSKLETQYKNLNKQDLDNTLSKLTEEYNELTVEIDNCGDASKRAELYAQRDGIRNQINDVATLASQYEGLTSAYNEWLSAQEAGQDRDEYESILSGREDIEKEMASGWLDDAAVEYLELLSGKELSTESIKEQIAAYKELDKKIGESGYSIWDFFTKDEDGNATSDGVFNFFDTVKSLAGETHAWIDENGDYHFDFQGFKYNDKTGDAAIAEILGTSEELVHVLLKAAEDAGFVVNIEGDYTELADLKTEAEQANDRMKELSATTYTFNFDSTDFDNLNEQISEAKSMLGNLKNEDGTLKVGVSEEDYRKAQDMIAALIYQKQTLDDSAILHVDTSQASTEIETAIGKLQEFRQYTNTLELETAIGADTSEATTNIQSVLTYIEGLNPDIKAGLGLDTTEVQTAIDSVQANIKAGVSIKQEDIDTVNAAISSISNGAMVDLGLNTELIDNYKSTEQEAKGTVNWDNNIEKVTAWINQTHEASGTINWGNNTENVKKTFFGNGYINWTVSEANGTANVNGTAFKQGSWGTKDSGTALMGELGRETIVRDGRFFTVGDNGAGFYKYQKGDIIFNHKQTEELFKNGIVTSGGGRGKALADGTAFSNGSNGNGNNRGLIASQVTVETKETKVETERDTSGSSGDGGNRNTIKDSVGETGNKKPTETSTSTKKEEKEFKETIDWIEIAIDRIERAIDRLDTKANSVYRTWSERNSALADEITKVKNEIDLQEKAYTRYIEEASKVGLSSSWAEKVRNGEVDISTITDEDLADKISEYQDWYEKALDCKDAILDLTEKESELYAQRFDNISTRYEGMLGVIEHEKNMLEEDINKAEVQGYLISSKYYDALIKNENRNIIELEKQKAEMLAELNTAIEGTEEWYRRVNEIDAITEAIEQGRTSISEYEQTIQQLSWETFDLLQDKISSVTGEADFLIELLSSEKLFDDKGRATDEGKATFGLHGQNYNTYMYQADLAAEEAERLKKQLESDPYDTELEKRYRSMVSLQQEYILNAQKEKEAIRDLVAEGIEIELDALQELIDKKNEELQSERDLYEYQKKVKEQTKEIASLEKQLAAFSGDDSEEAQQKIQQIKVDLESAREELQETEYDKFISDSKSLLDNLYLEYETLLNERLDNLDALVSDVINEINSDAAIISDTLSMKAEEVGYSLSDSMRTIWDDNTVKTNDVLTNYGKEFIDKQTTTNDALKTISSNIRNMITHLDKEADEDVEEDRTSSAAEPKSSAPSSTAKSTTTPPSNKGSSGDGTPKKGDKVKFIDGQYYYDSEGKNPSGSKYKGKEVYITNVNTRSWATHPYHISTGNKLGKGDLGWVKKNQISGYATGKRNFINDEIAWTQEKGREFIVRPSDGAILTPVAKGDSVLNASASNNIWNMANSPADFIRDNLGLGNADVPSGANVNNNVTQNFENVVFSMPNVHSYNELISQMQKDKNFEKLILSMSVDRLAGKSSLAKNKAIR